MKRFTAVRMLAAAALAGGLAAAPALAQPDPDGRIDFHGGSVAFIAGVNWGSGMLHFKGRDVPVKVSGIGVGSIGASSFDANGEVYHLRRVRDIEGTYTALNTQATAGGGAGEIDMHNDKGVEIHAHATSAGLQLSLAPSGMQISLK